LKGKKTVEAGWLCRVKRKEGIVTKEAESEGDGQRSRTSKNAARSFFFWIDRLVDLGGNDGATASLPPVKEALRYTRRVPEEGKRRQTLWRGRSYCQANHSNLASV